MEEIARAKLNLALHVRGREVDGYHRIETLFAFCEEGDVLCAADGEQISLTLQGPFGSKLAGEPDNLVLRAAHALAARYGIGRGAALVLDKRLPVASGIGGGSADAAAALRLLDRFWGIGAGEDALIDLARPLGADVPACLFSRTMRGVGRGDALERVTLPGIAGTPVLLVNPGVAVPTGPVFRAWEGRDGGPLPPDFRDGRNDLEAPAIRVAPVIAEVLDLLKRRPGAGLVRMSGSGATCFALFERAQDRDDAAAQIAALRPDWWRLATRLC
jgi:4-diphosphocytidyl-2-C-methyl-D-erythritol kinase